VTALRDPFDTVHKREDKFDYVTWSQVADRLDEAGEPWSFAIMGFGSDWAHGRLTIGERHFENIGYAENAEAAWKKEPLKDAASDAFKRCAALAGVARYLYDKDDRGGAPGGRPVAPPPRPPQRPHVVNTDVAEVDDGDWLPPADAVRPGGTDTTTCPIHEMPWAGSPGDLFHKDPQGRWCRHPDNVKRAKAR
jgi:hypothetical protein